MPDWSPIFLLISYGIQLAILLFHQLSVVMLLYGTVSAAFMEPAESHIISVNFVEVYKLLSKVKWSLKTSRPWDRESSRLNLEPRPLTYDMMYVRKNGEQLFPN